MCDGRAARKNEEDGEKERERERERERRERERARGGEEGKKSERGREENRVW